MKIFKAYDIRGIYPDELNEKLAYKIGRAFVKLIGSRQVVVGYDMRKSAAALFKALTDGITDQGADVIDIGMCTTPMMYYRVGKYQHTAGVMITASHNPGQYNGFKFVRANAVPVGGDTGIYEMRDMIDTEFESAPKGKIIKIHDFIEEYVENTLRFHRDEISDFTVVVDSGNAMASPVVERFFKQLRCKLIHLYPELDGSFPNHEANPLKPENMEDLQEAVKKHGADLGIAFDGDADRVAFVDEEGELITSDLITALIAKVLLMRKPGQTFLYDLRSSKVVREVIEENKGKAIMCMVGHSLIKAQMRKEDARFAGELSGHYYLQDNYYFESPFFVILKLLELMTKEKRKVSEIFAPLRKYYASGEINSKVADPEAKMQEIADKFKDAKVFWLDGVSVEYDNWWCNVRPSNTEPLLRLNLEADTKELMEEKRDLVLDLIRS